MSEHIGFRISWLKTLIQKQCFLASLIFFLYTWSMFSANLISISYYRMYLDKKKEKKIQLDPFLNKTYFLSGS